MAMRVPRGFARNIPYFREICEGVRPAVQDLPLKPFTGLPAVRIDEYNHDPIVLDPGTIVGLATGGASLGAGKLFPSTFVTGGGGVPSGLQVVGDTSQNDTWGLPSSTQANIACGTIKPIGIIYQPVYSTYLETLYTNYKRTDSVGVLCDYVISVPAINTEEVSIETGDVVMVGTGSFHGNGVTSTFSTKLLAGRYSKFNSSIFSAQDRVVGRCLKKLLLGTKTSAAAGDLLSDAISAGTFTISTAATDEFASLAMVQTVPGLGNSGSGTSGIPSYLLGARCNSAGEFYALTLLIRL